MRIVSKLGGDTSLPPGAEHCRAVYSTKVRGLEGVEPASNGEDARGARL
jgi:hypothetical protein